MKPRVRTQPLLLAFLLIMLPLSTTVAAEMLPGSEQQITQSWLDAWQKQSSQKSSFINRLVLSESIYLQQHADNPIDWYPWADTGLARAVKENKLIFLSVGYASCHWCHVMEAESFTDIDVANTLNLSFVSIKVDREQQPEIDAYYSLAVETIKGESGWPITVVLLPDGKPVFATNYISKDKLLTVLQRLDKLWNENPLSISTNASLLAAEIEQRSKLVVATNTVSKKARMGQAREQLLNDIDPAFAGFGLSNKFPDELKLQFLLNQYKAVPSPELKTILIHQLDAYMNNGMTDNIFGGVFRYTTDREMRRPHFEKMLYNQALTASLFVDAADWLERKDYRKHADSIIRFTNDTLRLADGLYAAAVDADFKGREGGYYLWRQNQLENMPPQQKSTVFDNGLVYIYGDIGRGGKPGWKNSLIQSRQDPPRVIENRITAWNALWLTALLDAGKLEDAVNLAKAVWKNTWVNNQLYRMGDQPAYLDDYSYLSLAFWQLYKSTTDPAWKKKARLLDRVILEQFYHNGELNYVGGSKRSSPTVDIYRDRELPASGAVVLRLFERHQLELEFAAASAAISKAANSQAGTRPENYLTLNLAGSVNFPVSDKIIAGGHAVASLRSAAAAGHWTLSVNLDPGWHINASEVFDKKLIPTRVQKNKLISKVDYPAGDVLTAEFSEKELNLYSDHVSININTPTSPGSLTLTLELQACSNRLCLLPEIIDLGAHRPVRP